MDVFSKAIEVFSKESCPRISRSDFESKNFFTTEGHQQLVEIIKNVKKFLFEFLLNRLRKKKIMITITLEDENFYPRFLGFIKTTLQESFGLTRDTFMFDDNYIVEYYFKDPKNFFSTVYSIKKDAYKLRCDDIFFYYIFLKLIFYLEQELFEPFTNNEPSAQLIAILEKKSKAPLKKQNVQIYPVRIELIYLCIMLLPTTSGKIITNSESFDKIMQLFQWSWNADGRCSFNAYLMENKIRNEEEGKKVRQYIDEKMAKNRKFTPPSLNFYANRVGVLSMGFPYEYFPYVDSKSKLTSRTVTVIEGDKRGDIASGQGEIKDNLIESFKKAADKSGKSLADFVKSNPFLLSSLSISVRESITKNSVTSHAVNAGCYFTMIGDKLDATFFIIDANNINKKAVGNPVIWQQDKNQDIFRSLDIFKARPNDIKPSSRSRNVLLDYLEYRANIGREADEHLITSNSTIPFIVKLRFEPQADDNINVVTAEDMILSENTLEKLITSNFGGIYHMANQTKTATSAQIEQTNLLKAQAKSKPADGKQDKIDVLRDSISIAEQLEQAHTNKSGSIFTFGNPNAYIHSQPANVSQPFLLQLKGGYSKKKRYTSKKSTKKSTKKITKKITKKSTKKK